MYFGIEALTGYELGLVANVSHVHCCGGYWIAAAIIGMMWYVTGEGLLALLDVAAVASAGFAEAAELADTTALLQYGFLVVVLSLLTRIAVPGVPR